MDPVDPIVLKVPGTPTAQDRGRAGPVMRKGPNGPVAVLGKGGRPIIRVHDTERSRSWKFLVQDYARNAKVPVLLGPLEMDLLAVFPLAKSHWKKTKPVPRRPKESKPDTSNLLKAVEDALNGIAYLDDSQIVSSRVLKLWGAQEEPGFTEIRIRAFGGPMDG